jgi:acylphosphatase
MTVRRWNVRVTGHVQGVGYRERVRRTAARYGLTGAVWNAEDGSVRIEVQGSSDALGEFLEAISGPYGASRPDRVERVREQPLVEHEAGFLIRVGRRPPGGG